MSLIIGLTGGIASGKSTVANMFKDMGMTVIDADIEARLAVEKGEQAYHEIIEAFGHGILTEDGSIDRAKLGSMIFNDEAKRLTLNNIVHPAVRRNMNAKKEAAIMKGEKFIVLDIPLLFESKLSQMADKTIVVYVKDDIQLQRLMDRNGFSKEEAMARIRSQMPLAEKKQLADAVIDNNGTIEQTKQQLIQILNEWS